MPQSLASFPINSSEVVALLLVAFYSGSRFNTPKIVRSQTSRVQFWLSGSAYVISSIGVFMLLAWAIKENPALVRALETGTGRPVARTFQTSTRPSWRR